MTRRFVALYCAVVFAALAVPAAAQSRINMTIPYEFTVSKDKLAAGDYVLSRPIPNDLRVFAFRGDAKNQKATVTTNVRTGDEAAKDSELIFARYGDVHFLRSIHIRGSREYYEVPMSSVEKAEAAKGEAVMVSIKSEHH
jgi:hypothetical protein